MPNIGAPELIIILVIALLILGPGKLPEVGASLGKSLREFRKASTDLQDSVNVNVDTSPLPAGPGRCRRIAAAPIAAAPVAAAPVAPRAGPAGVPGRRAGRWSRRRTSHHGTGRPRLRLDTRSRASRAPATRPWPTPTPCSSRVSAASPRRPIPHPRPRPPSHQPMSRSCRSSTTSASFDPGCSRR